jgi:hypothetical protein
MGLSIGLGLKGQLGNGNPKRDNEDEGGKRQSEMTAKNWRARNRQDLIVEVWEALDCESVGARELGQIQQALLEKFGNGALESPASMARTLADEGAVLRHAEVFHYDFKWRERNMAERSLPVKLGFSSFLEAMESFAQLDARWQEFEAGNDKKSLNELREVIATARNDALLIARSRILEQGQREEAKEISEWLAVWLQSPELFSDWLDLRRRSPEFRKKFC